MIFIDRMSAWRLEVTPLLCADDFVVLASSHQNLQLALEWLDAECEVVGMEVNTLKSKPMVQPLCCS